MRVDYPEMVELPNDRSETFIRAIQEKANPRLDLICCILTNNRKDRYDARYNSIFSNNNHLYL